MTGAGPTSVNLAPTIAKYVTPARFRALLTIFDQGVVSVANFALAVIVGRSCSREELGIYGLGFMIATLLLGVPRALVQTPYATYLPHWSAAKRSRFTGSAVIHLAVLALAGMVGLLLVAFLNWGAYRAGWWGNAKAYVTPLLLAPILSLVMAREHARRTCLAWHANREVVALDLAVSLCQVGLIWMLAQLDLLSGTTALFVWGAANGISIGWYFLRRDAMTFRRRAVLAHAKSFWRMARWLLAGALAALFVTTYYRIALSSIHGLAAMGVLTSAQSLVMVTNPIVLGIGNYLCPAMAATYAKHGAVGLLGTVLRATGVLLLLWSGLLGVLWLLGGNAVEAIFGDKYAGIGWEVFVIGIGYCSQSLCTPVEAALTAANWVRQTFLAGMVRLVLTLVFGTFFIYQYGVVGVGYGMLAANGGLLAVEWWMFRLLIDRERRQAAVATVPAGP